MNKDNITQLRLYEQRLEEIRWRARITIIDGHPDEFLKWHKIEKMLVKLIKKLKK